MHGGGQAERAAQRADDCADERVGNDAPQIIENGAAAGVSCAGDVDAAAHGDAVERGHQADEKQRAETHARLGGRESGDPCAERGAIHSEKQQNQRGNAARKAERIPKGRTRGFERIAVIGQYVRELFFGKKRAIPISGKGGSAIADPHIGKPRQTGKRTEDRLFAMRAEHALYAPSHRSAHGNTFQFSNASLTCASVSCGMTTLVSVSV